MGEAESVRLVEPMQMLIVQTVDGQQRVFELYGEDVTIGRERGRDLQLAHASVSRAHAQLNWSNGGYVINDLQSNNGVYVNGTRITTDHKLISGDLIRLGHFELIYIEGEVPRRFQKLNIHNLPRWHTVGTDVFDDATAQLSTKAMKRLLEARIHLEGGVLVVDDSDEIELEDGVWTFGRSGADILIKMLFASDREATITWNGRNHVLNRTGRRTVTVNGQSIHACTLEDGDEIRIGRSRFSYAVRK